MRNEKTAELSDMLSDMLSDLSDLLQENGIPENQRENNTHLVRLTTRSNNNGGRCSCAFHFGG